MRSGRLAEDQQSDVVVRDDNLPCCSEDIDSLKPLGTIHLSEHLINHTICHARTIMSSANTRSIITEGEQDKEQASLVRSSQTRRKRARRVWQLMHDQKCLSPRHSQYVPEKHHVCVLIFHSVQYIYSIAPDP
jgi:hypothetical protein